MSKPGSDLWGDGGYSLPSNFFKKRGKKYYIFRPSNQKSLISTMTQQDGGYVWSDDDDDDDLLTACDDDCVWSGEDDEWCHDVDITGGQPIQQGGAAQGLFHFNLQVQQPRGWRNIVERHHFRAISRQLRDPVRGDDLGRELTDAIHRALRHAIANESLSPIDRIHFTLQSDAFSAANNHCFQSAQFTVQEAEESSDRFNTYLQQLARQLNSNQSFDPDGDFSMDVTTIRMPPAGRGKCKYDPIKAAVREITKRSRITVKNKDDLCCARAIVTMKTWVDEQDGIFPEVSYRQLREGRPIQKTLAKQLHADAGVAEGPCSLEDIVKFQDFLVDYQIKVLKVGRPHMVINAGPVECRKRILLIQDGDHFDGCTSYGAFLNRNYFCHHCNKGYNTEDYPHHPCDKQLCRSCYSSDGCEDFLYAKEISPNGSFPVPTIRCDICQRKFFGDHRLANHVKKKQINCLSIVLQNLHHHLQTQRSTQRTQTQMWVG